MFSIARFRNPTPRDWAFLMEIKGRPRNLTMGSYLADMIANRRAILLTTGEARKFKHDAPRHGYTLHRFQGWRGLSDLSGEECDGKGVMFVPKET